MLAVVQLRLGWWAEPEEGEADYTNVQRLGMSRLFLDMWQADASACTTFGDCVLDGSYADGAVINKPRKRQL